ncbi:unnamed protein product, partial [Scytosiphon promiscuus]
PENFIASEFVFVVTDSSGEKAYGFCRRVLRCGTGGRYDIGRWRLPECLCLVSRRPFFGMFHSVLAAGQALRLLRQAAPATGGEEGELENGSSGGASYSGNKLEELLASLLAGGVRGGGVPGPGQELVASGLRFVRPVDEHMSLNDVPVTPLLVKLGPRNFLRLWSAILCERRILLVAEDVRTLSTCVHALMAMLYPFSWQHVFIPLLPADMLEYVSAPMPFVIGVRTIQLAGVKRQPMSEAVFVHLDTGELKGSTGMTPVPDICDGEGGGNKTTSLKMQKKERSREPGAERGPGSNMKGITKDGINDTASALFAEVKTIYSKAKKPKLGGVSGGGMATPDDHALRAALVGFNVGLFGDHRSILRRQPDTSVKIDEEYFIRFRQEQRGDSEGVIKFLHEFSQTQMFHMLMMHVKDRLLSKQPPSPRRGGPVHPSPATFMAVSDQLMGVRASSGDVSGGFSPASVKRALDRVLADSLPAGSSGSNSYGDPTLNPRALEATSNSSGSRDLTKLRAELCRTARDSAKLSGIMRVVWTRLQDCRGSKWPHALEGLRLLKALLLSGPEGCIADALSHVPAVRRLTKYPKGWEEVVVGAGEVAKAAPRIRTMAREVVMLMMDMKRLSLRREAIVRMEKRAAEAATSSEKAEKIKLRSR